MIYSCMNAHLGIITPVFVQSVVIIDLFNVPSFMPIICFDNLDYKLEHFTFLVFPVFPHLSSQSHEVFKIGVLLTVWTLC